MGGGIGDPKKRTQDFEEFERAGPELTDALIEEAYEENRMRKIDSDLITCKRTKFGIFCGGLVAGAGVLGAAASYVYCMVNTDVPNYVTTGVFLATMGSTVGLVKSIVDYERYSERIIHLIRERVKEKD